jgi:two-component system nitrogen regulation response regulator GlnG
LVNYFLKKFTKDQPGPPRSIAPMVLKALEKYHWPGNVRELENIIHRALVMSKGEAILLTDLPAEVSGQTQRVGAGEPMPVPVGEAGAADVTNLALQVFQRARREPKMKIIPAIERELVIQALKETEGNQVQAAKLLGISRATLRKESRSKLQ